MTLTLREGDVYRYEPETSWCREGMATVEVRRDGSTQLVDTYWRSTSDAHVLRDAELATAELLFNTADYRELDRYEQFEDFRPEDRQVITSQHGLRVRRFVKQGTEKDLRTMITNAEEAVEEAQRELNSATFRLQMRRDELERLRAGASA